MASKTFFFAIFLVLAAFGRADESADYWDHAKEDWDKTMNHLKKMFQIPTSDEAKKVAEDFRVKATEMADNLQADLVKLQESVKNHPEVQKAMKSMTDTVNAKVAELKAQNPEMAQNAEKLQEQVEQTFNSVMAEVKKMETELTKEGGFKDNVDAVLKKMVDDTKTTMQNLEKHLHESLGHQQH